MAEEELVTKEKFERTKSKLEAELTDIQDRYFHMSLKYAEVEAQREELVMQLRVAKSKKGWLS
ncbi:myosin-9-like [Trifolium medium]|uniref:Myosin-9-like n=1 Tax=Trifolium medium TaxID=97028 RepID=A0A392QB71_9FABA|nr:myosin-9-like [Trifolium medium]